MTSSVLRRPATIPLMRGRSHQAAFFVSVPAATWLFVAAPTQTARFAALVYGIALCGMFLASATYHLHNYAGLSRKILRRIDHSGIAVLIAATYTVFALMALDGVWQVALLTFVWTGAAFGVALNFFPMDRVEMLRGIVYITLGWSALLILPVVVMHLSTVEILFMFLGGLTFTSGAVVLKTQRPDPLPHVFGYHEVWHLFVIAGEAFHFVFVALLVLSAT